MILRNHGLLTVGETVCDAFTLMHFLVRACEIQTKVRIAIDAAALWQFFLVGGGGGERDFGVSGCLFMGVLNALTV